MIGNCQPPELPGVKLWGEGWGVGASGGESRGSAWPGRVRGSSGERQSLRGCRPEVGLQRS